MAALLVREARGRSCRDNKATGYVKSQHVRRGRLFNQAGAGWAIWQHYAACLLSIPSQGVAAGLSWLTDSKQALQRPGAQSLIRRRCCSGALSDVRPSW